MFHPTTFGKYFLTRRIAVGGMAEVFAAKLYGADGFEKNLVIKQILPQHARDPEFVQSFVAEAKIVVTLNHANIVSVYELGRVDGTYFIAMEYIEGQDTFALLDAARRQKDPLDPGLALIIVEEVCRGLDYAHRKTGPDGLPLGLIHRDLNPRNILIAREGEVKILDFGIAKTVHKSAAMPKTRAGVVKGTAGYMSPEQATGRAIDHRTDIYQSGLLLFECLTGQALFWRPEEQATRDLMRRHHVPSPSHLIPGLPDALDSIVTKALQIRPEARYETASAFGAAIARLRASHYPHANARMLGDWVVRLLERDRAATRAIEEEIPETADFSEVIGNAIERSIVTETNATAPKPPGRVYRRTRRPRTGSQPLDGHVLGNDLVTSPGHLVPSSRARHRPKHLPPESREGIVQATSTSLAVSSSLTSFGTTPNASSDRPLREDWIPISDYDKAVNYVLMALTAVAVALLVMMPWWLESQHIVRNSKRLASQAPTNGPKKVSTSTTTQAPTDPGPSINQRISTADFGTRPCPGKVTINDRTIPHPTPIFAYPLKPGMYRLTMTGDDCAPVNGPGALEPRQPRLTRQLHVELGVRFKVVADFKAGKIIIKKSPAP